jgi:hypothetical protein
VTRTELARPNASAHLHEVARHFAHFVNTELLAGRLHECHAIRVAHIREAYVIEARQLARAHSGPGLVRSSLLHLQRQPQIERDYEHLTLQVETSRGGVFEFTAELEFDLAAFRTHMRVKRQSIGRLDRYGNSSWCVRDRYPDLRQFCTCKSERLV